MAEHDSEREDREEREDRADGSGRVDGTGHPERTGRFDGADRADADDRADAVNPVGATNPVGAAGGPGRADGEDDGRQASFDEDAAWAAIVAGYGDEPPDPPGAKPFKSIEDLALLEVETNDGDGDAVRPEPRKDAPKPLGSSVTFAPGVGGAGPRDYSVAEPKEEDLGPDDEGHFVPPEPPPLPAADATAKFAWLGVLGGPLLLLLAVLFGWHMTWWLTTLAIGGFLGGLTTLVVRMRPDDEDDDEPGRGAVV